MLSEDCCRRGGQAEGTSCPESKWEHGAGFYTPVGAKFVENENVLEHASVMSFAAVTGRRSRTPSGLNHCRCSDRFIFALEVL